MGEGNFKTFNPFKNTWALISFRTCSTLLRYPDNFCCLSIRFKKYNQCVSTLFCQQEGHDTVMFSLLLLLLPSTDEDNNQIDDHDYDYDNQVGAVALDLSGNVASATSTGGITGKRGGRVRAC